MPATRPTLRAYASRPLETHHGKATHRIDGDHVRFPLLEGRAAGPQVGRRAHDLYTTPEWATLILLRHLPSDLGRVLEPCAGDGAIASVIRHHATKLVTNDLDHSHSGELHFDATQPWPTLPGPKLNWVITNPPFRAAAGILRQALCRCPNVELLLRLSFMEPTADRGGLVAEAPPSKLVVLPRRSFTGTGKTDSATSAWMFWSPLVDRGIVVEPQKR